MAIMQGRQQQRAIPIKHAKTTQKMAKNTSNARNTTANLQKFPNEKSLALSHETYEDATTLCGLNPQECRSVQ